jgi:hypothetical protein
LSVGFAAGEDAFESTGIEIHSFRLYGRGGAALP